MTSANYQEYLSRVYPETQWTIERLTGGLVNCTVRATLQSGPAEHSSLVLKHARPYIEVAGPEWKFSIDRQTVEATLLTLWGEHGALYPFRNGWISPRLVRHDVGTEASLGLGESEQEASVIVLADLGKLTNILDFLRATKVVDEQVKAIAQTVGRAFATFHSDATLGVIRKDQEATKVLSHDMASDVVFKAAIEPVLERLQGQPDADALYARVCENFKAKHRECLALGDFTAGTILMKEGDLTPIIVDWEFATIHGRGVNGDVVQFLADLRCAMVAEECAAVNVFADSFCAAYRDEARLSMDEKLFASCCIMLGREIVNQGSGVYEKHPRRDKMVQLGAAYIRGEDDTMVRSLFIE